LDGDFLLTPLPILDCEWRREESMLDCVELSAIGGKFS
jgi:hypothetical protein